MAKAKQNQDTCPCGNGKLKEFADTPFNYNSDPYATVYKHLFYQCTSCKTFYERTCSNYSDGCKMSDYHIYKGRLTKNEIKKIAPEGRESIHDANQKKIAVEYEALQQKGLLTPQLEKSLLNELGLTDERIANLNWSIQHPRFGQPKYSSVFEYWKTEVFPMCQTFTENRKKAKKNLDRILGIN